MTHFVVTTTWNSIDLVTPFLDHYRRLGFDGLFVMDFASTDGTRDILTSDEWRGFVDLGPVPGVAALDSSSLMLDIARCRQQQNLWCLFCDPDELLVTPSMAVRDLAPRLLDGDADSFVVRRFNVTAPLSMAQDADQRLTAIDGLTLRIAERHRRVVTRWRATTSSTLPGSSPTFQERYSCGWTRRSPWAKAIIRRGPRVAVQD